VGPPGFEPGSERPKRPMLDQATLWPPNRFIKLLLISANFELI
tara:strand:- start:14765 stop:14893 length:129 start_codon:yes stop_codon:yes gene_type:complete